MASYTGTVPIGTGEASMMALRISGIFPPVDKSITVSRRNARRGAAFQFFGDVGRGGGVAYIGVDLAPEGHANSHRLQVAVMNVGRNDRASRATAAHQLGFELSRLATNSISSVMTPSRAKCICDMLRLPFATA
jgi:hypothetical protein